MKIHKMISLDYELVQEINKYAKKEELPFSRVIAKALKEKLEREREEKKNA